MIIFGTTSRFPMCSAGWPLLGFTELTLRLQWSRSVLSGIPQAFLHRWKGSCMGASFRSYSGTSHVQLPDHSAVRGVLCCENKGGIDPSQGSPAVLTYLSGVSQGAGSLVNSSQSIVIPTHRTLKAQEGKSRLIVPGVPGSGVQFRPATDRSL